MIAHFPEDHSAPNHDSIRSAVIRIVEAYGKPEPNPSRRVYETGRLRITRDVETGALEVLCNEGKVFDAPEGVCDVEGSSGQEGWVDELMEIDRSILKS